MRQAVGGERLPAEVRQRQPGKQHQLADCQERDGEFQQRRLSDADDIDHREQRQDHQRRGALTDGGCEGGDVAADRHRDRRRGEDELHRLGDAGEEPGPWPETPHRIDERPTRPRQGAGELQVAEHERRIHRGDQCECREHPQRAGDR